MIMLSCSPVCCNMFLEVWKLIETCWRITPGIYIVLNKMLGDGVFRKLKNTTKF